LGPQGYGAFISTTALVGIFGSLTNLGISDVMIMNVARDPQCFSGYWGKILFINLTVGSVFLVVILSISQFAFSESIPVSLIFMIAVSDLLFSPILGVSGQAFQAFQRLDRTALIQIIPSLLRLIAIGSLAAFVQVPTVLHWGGLYLTGTVLSASIAIWLVHKELGPPCFALTGIKTDMIKGLHFFVGNSSHNIYANFDKILLTNFYGTATTGSYGAACRVIDLAFSPIASLLSATYARFFQYGERGVRSSFEFAKKIFPFAAFFGLFIWVLVILIAPVFPQVLGNKYDEIVDILILLAPVPFIKTIYFFAADSLTGAGFQLIRSQIQAIVALFNVGLNLWLIPLYGWYGAAWANIITSGILASLVCFTLLLFLIKDSYLQKGNSLI
jgi:O-antigen/teichoic acid export membrane protein